MLLVALIASACLLSLHAQAQAQKKKWARRDNAAKKRYDGIMDDENRTVGFLPKTIRDGNAQRAYAVWVPLDYNGQKPLPVMLYLHDERGGGIYGKRMLRDGLPEYIDDTYGKFDWIVVIPQALRSEDWSDNQLALAVSQLAKTQKQYRTDSQRVYLAGHGEGAAAAMRLAAKAPKRFAAMLTVEGADRDVAGQFPHLPIWMWNEDKARHAREAFAQMAEADQLEARYTERDERADKLIEDIYSSKQVLDWLYQHTISQLGRYELQPPTVDAATWTDRPLATRVCLDDADKPVLRPPDLPTRLRLINGWIRDGKISLAMKKLDEAIEGDQLDEADMALAKEAKRRSDEYLADLLTARDDYIKHKNYPDAMVVLYALKNQFELRPEGKAAEDLLVQWEDMSTVQNEIKAGEYYQKARKVERSGRRREAGHLYREIAKRYPDTRAGNLAQRRYDTLKAEGRL